MPSQIASSQALSLQPVQSEILPLAAFEPGAIASEPSQLEPSQLEAAAAVAIAPRRGRRHTVKRPRTSPDLFPQGLTDRMASNRLIWEGCTVLSQGRSLDWAETDDGLHYQSPVAKGKGYISFSLTNDLYLKDPSVLEGEVALALIEEFDIRAACLHLIYAAFATQLERPWEQQFVISDRQLERYLGLDKNKKLNKQQKLELLLHLAKQPCSLLVYVSWPDKGKVKSFSVSRTWLWEISEPILHFQETISGHSELVGFTLQVRAGNWAQYFLNAERCKDGTGYYEYGILSQSLLQDVMSLWYNHEGAARLMLWLLFKTRVSNSPVRVGTLFKVAFGVEKIEMAREDAFARKRLVKQWKTLLKVLHERDWKLTFDAATYPPQYLPDFTDLVPLSEIPDDPQEAAEFWAKDAQKAEGERLTDLTRKPYGGFEPLLMGLMLIQPPAEITTRLQELNPRSPVAKPAFAALPEPDSQPVNQPECKPLSGKTQKRSTPARKVKPVIRSGQELKDLRVSKGMTQSALATHLGKSTSWVKLVETDRRNITAADQTLLQRLFEA
ncbi:MAG: helix-turn-helix transcriptional regulator [Oscillatoriophycideae cyanobacterium NC_groundwater_1537_Pr4_S-0.65um_50_18]|nr:helix-turn-helix transcriptional regulator [Oscillatoriophycideae cyanobacterium NC_groundwater_1537_Pr4_S-0.65um_50_18]